MVTISCCFGKYHSPKSLRKIKAFDQLASITLVKIPCNANRCFDVYINFLRVNSNTCHSHVIGHHWDDTYFKDCYIMRLAESIMCRYLLDNDNYTYLIRWANWQRNNPTWISQFDLMQQLKDECVDLIYELNTAISLVSE